MFRMNGMPRAHDCRDAGGRAMQEQLPRDAQERPVSDLHSERRVRNSLRTGPSSDVETIGG